MDNGQFDRLTQAFHNGATRRVAFRLLTGGALSGAAGRLGFAENSEAKRKRKKKHKRGDRCFGDHPKRCSPTASDPRVGCFPTGYMCCGAANGGGACPPGFDCCPPTQGAPDGNCAGLDEVCCSVEDGGGYCPNHLPVCCGPTPAEPVAQCIPAGLQCCPFGGYCYDDETCCAPSPAFPEGVCAPRGFGCPRAGATDLQSEDRFVPIRRADSVPRGERGRRS